MLRLDEEKVHQTFEKEADDSTTWGSHSVILNLKRIFVYYYWSKELLDYFISTRNCNHESVKG